MRYLLVFLLAGGLIYVFYAGLLETNVLQDTSTPTGYYKKEVDSKIELRYTEDGDMRLSGYHHNTGNRDLRNIRVEVFLPNAKGETVSVDILRLGVLRAGKTADIDVNLDVPMEFPSPTSGKFRYTITAEFDGDEDDDY